MRRSAVVAAALTVAAVLTSAPARAHITAEIDGGTPGGYGLITLRVPTESDTAGTVKVEVHLPDDIVLPSVRVQPVPGWRTAVVKKKIAPVVDHDTQVAEAVDIITWTATGPGIAPGEFGQFQVLAGPLPDAATLTLPAVQTYSDGSQVNWTQQATGDVEPERPAPTVPLAAAHEPEAAAAPPPVSGWVAVGMSALAVLLGGAALLRTVRRKPTGTDQSG